MNHKDLASEYKNIKAYCRKESAKSFKHPLVKHGEPPARDNAVDEKRDLSDAELEELMRGD